MRRGGMKLANSVPTASSRYMHIKQRTTYDRHYNENADAVVTQIRDIVIEMFSLSMRGKKEMIGRVLAAYKTGATPIPPARCAPTPPPPRPPSHSARRSNVPACTPISDFNGNQGHNKGTSTPSDFVPNYNEDGIEIPNGHVPNIYNPGANFMRENPTPRTPVVHDNPPVRPPDSPWRPARTPNILNATNNPVGDIGTSYSPVLRMQKRNQTDDI
ncbi:hypothetical protein KUTeg_025066 [Tegillarca granosa]|uniref:Uncharacterized protein n=1 Tax=Tegillarca granosa TaxID=220873 RepID=A0ABQ9E046_TEGGR|nr:hypothetical protein KUTeg_025066 [Tegillarca granosa]